MDDHARRAFGEILDERHRTINEAAELSEPGDPRYLALMTEVVPAIDTRIDALVREHCPRFVKLSRILAATETVAEQDAAIRAWIGERLEVVGAMTLGREITEPTRAVAQRHSGSLGYTRELHVAIAGATGHPFVRLATGADRPVDMHVDGRYLVTGKLLGGWSEGDGLPYDLDLDLVDADELS